MTRTVTGVQSGPSLPGNMSGNTVLGTGAGRHRGRRADENQHTSMRDFAGHGRHRRPVRSAGTASTEGSDAADDDSTRSPALDGVGSPDRERRVADDLAALDVLILRERTLLSDRAGL